MDREKLVHKDKSPLTDAASNRLAQKHTEPTRASETEIGTLLGPWGKWKNRTTVEFTKMSQDCNPTPHREETS